jgi:hypothetical protein
MNPALPSKASTAATASSDPASAVHPVISLKDAARIANQHPVTLKRRANAGKLTILALSTRRRGIRRSELERYLSSMEMA